MERSVTHHALIRETDQVYKREDHQRYVHPEPFASNRTPDFPAVVDSLWSFDESVSIIVTLIVDESGKVTDVRWQDAPDSGERRLFFDQVAAACLDWRFTPLQVRTTKVVSDGEVFGLPKGRVVSEVRELPFSINYEFLFSEHGVVTNAQRN